jgi:hypothetical protein
MKLKYFIKQVCGVAIESMMDDLTDAEVSRMLDRYAAWKNSNA